MNTSQQHSRSIRRRQRGMSIIELMVSLALSATLLAGVVGVFVTMFQADRAQEGVSRMQESGRFALNFLAQDLRMAGYMGCSSTLDSDAIINTLNGAPASFQPDRAVQGWEADNSDPGVINNSVANEAVGNTATSGWSTSGGNVIDSTKALPGTDIFRIWGADPTVDTALTGKGLSGSDTALVVSLTPSIVDGDILLLSDCEVAEWVQACNTTNLGGTPATMRLTLSQSGGSCSPGNIASMTLKSEVGARVMKVSGTVYYVGKRGDVATNPPTLFRRTLSTTGIAGTPEELVEGIEDMQILYGENTNDDNNSAADRFLPADQVSNWENVVSLRITLLVQSFEDNLVAAPQAYTFNGVIYNGATGNGANPPDKKLRRVFTTTINLRNVTLGG